MSINEIQDWDLKWKILTGEVYGIEWTEYCKADVEDKTFQHSKLN